jgi:hypothetical protein
MSKNTRLTRAAVKIGTAAGRADRTAHRVADAAKAAADELLVMRKRVEALARDLKKARKRVQRALR